MSFKTIGVKLDGVPTDIVIGNFTNNIFIVLTQVKKFGSIISVKPEAFKTAEGQQQVYDVRNLLGLEKESSLVAARFLAEQLEVPKPIIFSISLKDDSPRVLKSIKKVLLDNKCW
ncbi:unnamed protein product [Bemisia tabaci]|uniref:Proteasome assembly chaperone 3 n=1 Tax=Bemisia tabaci TaxID=7038 RepID=A0A9P0FAA2_BEMTA|nr:unnamed protein product [Bemisia tabaci]